MKLNLDELGWPVAAGEADEYLTGRSLHLLLGLCALLVFSSARAEEAAQPAAAGSP